jgi:hypothetical protein
MRSRIHRRVFVLLLACCAFVPCLSVAQAVANKQAVLSQAREAYYNLRTEGLDSFECSIIPNWELLLQKEMEQNPDGAKAAIDTLNQLQFTLNLASDSSVKLTHNELEGQSKEMMDALKQIYEGMEQMASGFFDTWKLFVLSPPFPATTQEYQLAATGPQYKLSYMEEGTTDVVTTMARDFAISDMKITTAQFDSSIQPSFTKTPKGLLLNAYKASYQSQKPEEATQLDVRIGYSQVEGLQMLQKLNLSGSYGGTPFAIELAFSDCKVTKKP